MILHEIPHLNNIMRLLGQCTEMVFLLQTVEEKG